MKTLKAFCIFVLVAFCCSIAAAQSTVGPVGITANGQCASITVSQQATVGISVGGSFSATLTPSVSVGSLPGTNVSVTPIGSSTSQTTITAGGNYSAVVSGMTNFSLCATAYASGTVFVYLNASPAVNGVSVTASGTQNVAIVNSVNTGTQTITASQCATVSLNGSASVIVYITAVNGVFSAGNLLLKEAPDSVTYNPVQLEPWMPSLGGILISSIPFGSWAAGAAWAGNLGPSGNFQVCGDGTLAGGTSVSVFVSAGAGSLVMPNGLLDSSGNLNVHIGAGSISPGTTLALGMTNATNTSLTTAVVAKASAGNLYGWIVTNNAATTCFLQFIQASSAPTLGTAALFSVLIPATTTITVMPGTYGVNMTPGISYGLSTTYNGASACGTAGAAVILYK